MYGKLCPPGLPSGHAVHLLGTAAVMFLVSASLHLEHVLAMMFGLLPPLSSLGQALDWFHPKPRNFTVYRKSFLSKGEEKVSRLLLAASRSNRFDSGKQFTCHVGNTAPYGGP
jgi:hypothetical protein